MGLRAYLMVKVIPEMRPSEFLRAVQELEDVPGVDFVDPVIGSSDLVIMIEAPITVDTIASKVRQISWVKHVDVLRIVSMVESCHSSKSNLLKSLSSKAYQPISVN